VSLLERLRQPAERAAAAWKRFVELYSPLLYSWARRLGLQPADAADLVQDILTLLVKKIPAFRYEQGKCFRAWLWTVSLNKWRENQRKPVPSTSNAAGVDVPDPAAGDPAVELAEAEYRGLLIRRAQQLMQAEFPTATWKAYWDHVICGKPAAAVAAELGITVNAVYVAKCRVLRRLREELAGLLE
jgi:RNA polymerase sigma-70 factor (ECF subfamily)